MESPTSPLRRSILWLALAAVMAGGCGQEEPVALEMQSDPDEPFPTQRFVEAKEAEQRRQYLAEQTERMIDSNRKVEHCPQASRARLDVALEGGPTYDRISAASELEGSIQLVEPPVPLPGLHFYEVIGRRGGSTVHYTVSGCYVDDQRAYCAGRRDAQPLASLIHDYGLTREPDRLSEADWARLLAVFGQGLPWFPHPELTGCVDAVEGPKAPPVGTVKLSPADASISMPILNDEIVEDLAMTVTVEIHDGRVETEYRFGTGDEPTQWDSKGVAGPEAP